MYTSRDGADVERLRGTQSALLWLLSCETNRRYSKETQGRAIIKIHVQTGALSVIVSIHCTASTAQFCCSSIFLLAVAMECLAFGVRKPDSHGEVDSFGRAPLMRPQFSRSLILRDQTSASPPFTVQGRAGNRRGRTRNIVQSMHSIMNLCISFLISEG